MKTIKLILGILTTALSCFVLFQSCVAGVINTLVRNGESSGTSGVFIALLMLAGGITMIVSHKNTSKGGSVAGVIIFLIAALIGIISADSVFKTLIVWSVLCVILAAVNLLAVVRCKKNNDGNPENDKNSDIDKNKQK